MNDILISVLERQASTARALPHPGLNAAIHAATDALLSTQQADGHWCFELEADCTIPAEYVLMMHYMDELDVVLQGRIARYLRMHQQTGGGWPLYYGGAFDLSCTVKAYYALKLAGDRPDEPHMMRARALLLAHGGAAHVNVFTRITLALFEQVPWRAVPFIPVEILLMPEWFPFHIAKVSYWSRTVMVPLLVLCSLKPRARNPLRVGIAELFAVPPHEEKHYFPSRSPLNRFFFTLDRCGRALEPLIPRWIRRRALQRADAWIQERLNDVGGLGAIFPAIVNSYEALACLGYDAAHPGQQAVKAALEQLLVIHEDYAYCQPCFPPVWDTALACLALQTLDPEHPAVLRALEWLRARQLVDQPGDWRASRPRLTGGGWPFQYENDYYPDLDDTSAVAWSMSIADQPSLQESLDMAVAWVSGMQSRNGGFAAFDVDNTRYYLNEIPFADHGALLDPPTADVSARCLAILARVAPTQPRYAGPLRACLRYLREEQEACGAWFGRWGTNYLYGTWSVLSAFEEAGVAPADPAVRKAVAWLKQTQQADGGWGEHNDSYLDASMAGGGSPSTSFQTSWAMLGLMAAGETHAPEVHAGAAHLIRTQEADGFWSEPWFTAPGFPRVFYLKYHGYSKYFPLWALARYRSECGGIG